MEPGRFELVRELKPCCYVNRSLFFPIIVLALALISPAAGAETSLLDVYQCANQLENIHMSRNQRDQMFLREGILFTSYEAESDQHRGQYLLVTDGRRSFAYTLPKASASPVAFEVTNLDPRFRPTKFFMTYSHSEVRGHSYQGFAVHFPIFENPGAYHRLKAHQIPNLTARYQFLIRIRERLNMIHLKARSEGITKAQLFAGNFAYCRNLSTGYPRITQMIDRHVDLLERLVPTPPRWRAPASY